MTEYFLDDAQIGTAFEQMGCCGVPQSVWREVRYTGNGPGRLVHHRPHLPLPDATASLPEEQGGSRGRGRQGRPPDGYPPFEGIRGRQSVGHCPFLVAFTKHSHNATFRIHVVEVEPAELADTDTGRIQQFDDHAVSQRNRMLFPSAGLCSLHDFCCLLRM